MTQIKQNALRITTESADRSWTGVAAAWANLNGTGTIALRDSQNISGAVDNGTGNYTFNFSSNMAGANYSPSGGVGDTNGSAGHRIFALSNSAATAAVAVGSCRVISVYGVTNANFDAPYVCPTFHGGLA